MNLMGFQRAAVIALNEAMKKSVQNIVLDSPTGSGKTVILTTFMSEYMRMNSNIVFIWLTPGKAELQEQSKEKMEQYHPEVQTKNLADVMAAGFAAGDAVFINWQKLNMRGNVALKDGERTNFLEWIATAKKAGIKFKVVIDESHENFTGRSQEVIDYFDTDKIIRASATPKPDANAIWVKVDEVDVINEGLIKKLIIINPDFPANKRFANEDEVDFLLEEACKKREEIRQAFVRRGRKVNPLIVVQMPNNSEAQLAAVEAWFADKGVSRAGGGLAVWLANDKENLDGIERNDARQVAVVTKLAIATGWDCPRAHILVKLRHGVGEAFEIQTIGRIRRMPEAEHYGDDVLDSCYLYTLDSKFTEGARASLKDRALNAKWLTLKPEYKSFTLTKEQRTQVSDTRDPVMALEAAHAFFAKKYRLGDDKMKNVTQMKAKEYEFSLDILNRTATGDATVIGEMLDGRDLDEVSFSVALNTHKHGQYFRHAVGEIGAGCRIGYNETRVILSKLFGTMPADRRKFLSLEPKALYAFTINNMRLLKDDLREAMAAELPGSPRCPISEKPFRIPQIWLMTYDPNPRLQANGRKNVYSGYLLSARPRSAGELEFERWAEQSSAVEWWYKNGDKGDEYFSLVYTDNLNNQWLFYPDYILRVGGEIWIVEVKGNFNASGGSENIDLYAAKKADALREYCAKHGINGGVACFDEQTRSLLISTDGFSERVNDPCWNGIEDEIGGEHSCSTGG